MLLPQMVEHMVSYTMILTHRKLLILSLAISDAVSTLGNSASTGLKWNMREDTNPEYIHYTH